MIWVGEEAVLGALAMAVPVADCPSTQVSCNRHTLHRTKLMLYEQVIGSNEQSLQLSSQLAKKLSKQVTDLDFTAPDESNLQVLVSFNLEDDIMFTPMVVGRLMKEIKEKPDKF